MISQALEAYLMKVELAQELYACVQHAMLASHLQRKLGIIQWRPQGSPSSAQVVQQPGLIPILAVQTHLHIVMCLVPLS